MTDAYDETLQPDEVEDEPDLDIAEAEKHHGLLDKLRHSAAGTNDPNIVGDPGPFGVAPGADPIPPDQVGPGGLPLLPPDEEGTAVV